MYRYKIKQGAEDKVFAGDGVKNLGNGVIESDHELTNPYLVLDSKDSEQMTAAKPAASTSTAVPAQSIAPAQATAVPTNPVPKGDSE
jgi:hypothetical protein